MSLYAILCIESSIYLYIEDPRIFRFYKFELEHISTIKYNEIQRSKKDSLQRDSLDQIGVIANLAIE
jgi:hypothetical protein